MLNAKVILFVIGVFAVGIKCDKCADVKCADIPKHYEELGCVEIREKGACCPTRFECPDFKAMDQSKCHFKGRALEVSAMLPESETVETCSAGCRCTKYDGRMASFTCAQIECPDLFTGRNWECVSQHEPGKCCRVREICDKEQIAALPKCYENGQVHHLGETFYPESEPCHKCICTEDFSNATTILNNKSCHKIDCGIELRHLTDFHAGCVPIYFGDAKCCPIEIKCPTKDDKIVPSELKSDATGSDVAEVCTYGDMKLKLNEAIETGDKCTECRCVVPPMITCVKHRDC